MFSPYYTLKITTRTKGKKNIIKKPTKRPAKLTKNIEFVWRKKKESFYQRASRDAVVVYIVKVSRKFSKKNDRQDK